MSCPDRRRAPWHDGGSLAALRGQVAIASARLAYAAFLEITQSPRWRALEAKGAKKQRLLWASTGTKNPEYSDVLYVESLIGPDTIATVPPETLRLFDDHGVISLTLTSDQIRDARRVIDRLADGGIDFRDVNHTLEEEGIAKFVKSFDGLLRVIADKRRRAGVLHQSSEPLDARLMAAYTCGPVALILSEPDGSRATLTVQDRASR